MSLRRKRTRLTTVIVLLAAAALLYRLTAPARSRWGTSAPTPSSFTALCTRVIDGDTIELASGEHVRYIGIDTPEMRPVEAWAEAATEANRKLVEGKTVRVVPGVQERDRYGRLLAYVWVDDVFVNEELVRQGYARVATYPPNVRYQERFLAAEREARRARRGLWSSSPDR